MKELNETESKALAAVNAAVNPHGFKAEYMDTVEDEIWFTLWFMDEKKQKEVYQSGYFEACYYTKPKYGKVAGDIVFGVMGSDWTDLPDAPSKACEVYARWSRQKPLFRIIAEVSAK